MGIPNTKKYRIRNPGGPEVATIVAVLPKGANVDAYLADAAKRFDWNAWKESLASNQKIRVGQQKQKKKK